MNIILFSTGRESLLNLYRCKKPYIMVFFNYGQKAFKKELKGAEYYSGVAKSKLDVFKVSLNLPKGIKTGVGDTHVVARNLLFILHVVNRYYKKGERLNIYVGATKSDHIINDGYYEGLKRFEKTLRDFYPEVRLKSQCKKFYDRDTFPELLRIKADLSHLWMCDNNKPKMCGKCAKCLTLQKELKQYYELYS